MLSQPSLFSFSLTFCAEAVQLAHSCLSGRITVNVGVYLVCSWEVVSSLYTLLAIVDPPQILIV